MRDTSVIRVVHVVGQMEIGGMENLLIEFARYADRSRFHLHFVSLTNRGILADDLESCGFPVTAIHLKKGMNPIHLFRLSKLFRTLRARVVHTHNTRPLIYAGPAARLAGIPCIVHTRHGQRFESQRHETLLFSLASRTTNSFVCVSHDSAQIAKQEGIPLDRIRTIWNGIDLGRFMPTTPANRGPVVAIGRLSPEKDFATLIRAAGIAAKEDSSFRLEIAGDGICFPKLATLVQENHLEQVVRLLGQVRDVPSLLQRGRFFAMSSLTEGISLTILEAMATGLPVVATRVGGNPEIVIDSKTGLLVPSGDAPALAKAMLQLWNDPNRCLEMGRVARERIESCFDVQKMVKAYEALYLEKLAK